MGIFRIGNCELFTSGREIKKVKHKKSSIKYEINVTTHILVTYIHDSFGPIGGIVKFTKWQSICHVELTRSILFNGHVVFKIDQLRTRPM